MSAVEQTSWQRLTAKQTSWQLLTVALVSYILFIVTSSMSTWLSFISDDKGSQTASQSISLVLLVLSVLLPVLYLVFAYVSIMKPANASNTDDIKAKLKLNRQSILIIMMSTFLFMLISSSLGIYLANHNNNWSSTEQENGVQVTFIVILVMTIMLPILYAIFFFRRKICEKVMNEKEE